MFKHKELVNVRLEKLKKAKTNVLSKVATVYWLNNIAIFKCNHLSRHTKDKSKV